MIKYFLVPKAREDLYSILDYIADESISSAVRVHGKFSEVFQLLGDNPYAGHLREDLTSQPFRFFPVYSYMVIYLADKKPIQVVRVLNGAQNIAAILID